MKRNDRRRFVDKIVDIFYDRKNELIVDKMFVILKSVAPKKDRMYATLETAPAADGDR